MTDVMAVEPTDENETDPTQGEAATDNAETTETTEGKKKEEFTLQSVKKRFFPHEKLGEAQDYVAKVASVCPTDDLKSNFDPTKEQIGEGYGLCVVPISRREKGTTKVIGVSVAMIPEFSTVFADPKGKQFVIDVIHDELMTKVASSARPKDDGEEDKEISIPRTIEEFVTTQRRTESLKVFNKHAPSFVRALRKKARGMKFLNSVILRQCLASKSFAEEMFPKVPQESWLKILEMIIAECNVEGDDPAVIESWQTTRDDRKISLETDSDSFDTALAGLT